MNPFEICKMSSDNVSQDENLRLADLRFRALRGNDDATMKLKEDLAARKALPFYILIASELVRLKKLFTIPTCCLYRGIL